MPTLLERWSRRSLRKQGFQSHTYYTSVGPLHGLSKVGGGSLPWVILLHGFGSAGVFLAPLAKLLLPAVTGVHILDLPGHGFSPVPSAGLTPHSVETGAKEAIRGLRCPSPRVVLGNSLGGLLGVRMALEQPEETAALVLLSPAGTPMNEHQRETFFDTFRIHSHDEGLAFVDKLLSERPTFRHFMALDVRRRLNHPALRCLLESAGPDAFLTPEQLAGLSVPTFLFWGADDEIMPASHLAFFRQHLPPHAVIDVARGFGHSPYLDDSVGLAWRILRFLDRQLAQDDPS